jgi:hypothetical protein
MLQRMLEVDYASEKYLDSENVLVYRNEDSKFLPHFYTPKAVINTSQNLDILPDLVSQKDYNIRSVIYFNDNKSVGTSSSITAHATTTKDIFNPKELKKKTIENIPIIEFKKIDPTKYRVVIHHATGNFPLVFSESFNDDWNSYLVDYEKKSTDMDLSDYKILDDNKDDQASGGELQNLIDAGYISTLGDLKEKEIKHMKWQDDEEKLDYIEKYKIDFISKNFQDTIQNDNLSNGHLYDTWFAQPIDGNSNHSIVNGYANSWNLNVEKICLENKKCVKNSDGSYDMELVIEFWPQRLFYLGAIISLTTLLGSIGYLIYDFVRRRKYGILKP